MIPSSVRRVVGVAPQSSPVVSSLAASAIPLSRSSYKPNSHQRRYSSSKPSSKSSSPASVGSSSSKPSASDNGSSSHASSSNVSSSSSSGPKRKAKAKAAATPTAPALKLPSVPSTMHLKDEAIAMSTFFALHRPISVTQILPKKVSNEAFARIFDQDAATKPNWEDVISTLSQTTQQLQLQQQQMVGVATAPGVKPMFQFETSIQHQLDTMTGQYRPYNPPPPPEPMMNIQQDVAAQEGEGQETSSLFSSQATSTRVYKALVTIEETRDADGVLQVIAHSPKMVEDVDAGAVEEGEQQHMPARSGGFLERMALRQLEYEAARDARRPSMYAISVKRQRKLKMKKKKYKKLMRKTRNIRRKLDRL